MRSWKFYDSIPAVRFGRVPKRPVKEISDIDTSDSEEKPEVSSTTSPEPLKTEMNQVSIFKAF